MSELLAILQLVSAGASVYNKSQGKSGLDPDLKAIVDALPVILKHGKTLLSKPEYRSIAWQLQLAMDSKDIREAIGAPPAPEGT